MAMEEKMIGQLIILGIGMLVGGITLYLLFTTKKRGTAH